MKPTVVTRFDLYTKVWETPGWLLAREFGISDVAIGKVCRKNNIPRPPRGWWRKREVGKKIHQPPLPNRKINPELTLGATADATWKNKRDAAPRLPEYPPIIIRERLAGLHPLVEKTKDYLAENNPGSWHWPKETLNINVFDGSRRRALLLMDALICAMEKHGWRVIVENSSHGAWRTSAVIDNVKVEFHIQEIRRRRYGEVEEKMAFIVDECCSGLRRMWQDGKRQRLEQILHTVMAGLEAHATYLRERIVEEQKKQRTVMAERARRAQIVAEYEQERIKAERLCKDTDNWDRAERMRRYVSAVRAKAETTAPINPDSEIGKWLQWALAQADRVDPLTESPESVLDSPPPRDWYDNNHGVYGCPIWSRRLYEHECVDACE